MKIAVVGLGRLGLSLAVALASRGVSVVGVDTDLGVLATVGKGKIPWQSREPRLAELFSEVVKSMRFVSTNDVASAVARSQATIVLVDTPSELGGDLSPQNVLLVCRGVGVALRNKDAYHTIIISSTVMPGTCEGLIQTTLEQVSGKRVGVDFGLCCCPEFVAQGNAVKGFLQPDFVLVGASDARAGSVAEGIYRRLCTNEPPIYRMSLTSAEVAKIGLNVAVIMKMTAAAQITWMCERYSGADADAVLSAIGADYRIGHAFFSKTLWPGGPCFPRDSRAFVQAASKVGQAVPVAEAVDKYLTVQIKEMAALVQEHAQGRPIGILGLTYKYGVNSTVGSYGLALADELMQTGCEVDLTDPHAQGKLASLEEVIKSSAVLVVAVEHPDFRILEELDLSGKVVVDCRGFLDESKISGEYVRQGRGI